VYQTSQEKAGLLQIGGRQLATTTVLPALGSTSTLFRNVAWLAAVLLLLGYAGYFATLTSFPFQDYPNHMARAAVLSDLIFHHGERFAQLFQLHPLPIPYSLHDVLLVLCVAALGVKAGAGLFAALVFASLPAALLLYLRLNHLERASTTVLLLGLYLATDSFFFMAFMGFKLALAVIVVCMALTDRLRRRWSARMFWGYALVVVAGYLTHLTALVFFAPVLALSGLVRLWTRGTTVRAELMLWIPVAALLVVHFGLVERPHGPADPAAYAYFWGSIVGKLRQLRWDFWRYGGRPSRSMMCLFAACILWAVRGALTRRAVRRPIFLEHLLLAAFFFCVYWVLPAQYADSSFVDLRALPMIVLFLLLAAVHLAAAAQREGAFDSPVVISLAFLLAAVNLGYLIVHVQEDDAWIGRYRQLVAAVPVGAHVLPVNTLGTQSSIAPYLHAGSYLVLDRAAVMPYLFSGDRGDPMKYFRYTHRPYMPDEFWYLNHREWHKAYPQSYEVDGRWYTWRFVYSKEDRVWYPADLAPVDWTRVACAYDYILVTKPFEPQLIDVPLERVAANDTAALLAIPRSACRPAAPRPDSGVRLPLEH
jgi:hypothetical protein